MSKNRGNDRGRGGEGGAKAWSRVLYEIDTKHADASGATVFEHVVYAINNGKGEGEGSHVDEDNFMSYARVTVGGTQNYIAVHLKNKDIKRARILEFGVGEPVERRGRKQAVPGGWYD